jgi:hypothetical protein
MAMRSRVPGPLLRLYDRHDVAFKVGALILGIVVVIALSHDSVAHPTRESAAQRLAADALAGRQPHLSDAEIRALNQPQDVPARQWVTEQTSASTPVHHLDGPGELELRVGYSDGAFYVSDVRHLVTDHDVDPIDVSSETHAVVAGGPGEAMVFACCEGNDARVTLAVLRAAPARVPRGWAEVTDLDLDVATGHLAFAATGGVSQVVTVPAGRYRMRVTGVGAVEFEQDRERFRIELWPRHANTPTAVLRTARER